MMELAEQLIATDETIGGVIVIATLAEMSGNAVLVAVRVTTGFAGTVAGVL